MNILISLLGHTPGAVTGAYYALARDGGVPVNRLVTVSTENAYSAENYVLRELERWRREGNAAPEYGEEARTLPEWAEPSEHYRRLIRPYLEDATRVRIPFDDVNEPEAVDCFRETLRVLLADVYREHEVYVCVAGGRKSMAAIATLAAQLYGYSVRGLYHLYVTPEITLEDGTVLRPEESGTVEGLGALYYGDQRNRLLRPEPADVELVELPYFHLTGREGKLELVLQGEVEEYILEWLRENPAPALLDLLGPDTRQRVHAYLYEVKVSEYLMRQGYVARHHYKMPGHKDDVDVYAEREGELLICECRFFLAHDPRRHALEKKKVEQIVRRLDYLGSKEPGNEVTAWVVTNANQADASAWRLADERGIRLVVGRPSRDWETNLFEFTVTGLEGMPRS